MHDFELDARLANDCYILGKLDISLLLLMNNSLVPWFILVPKTTKTEMTDLAQTDQEALLKEEGVTLGSNDAIDLKRHLWSPPRPR